MPRKDAELARAYYRDYDAKRREEKREYARAYREKNKDRLIAWRKENYERYREKNAEYNRIYRERNKEEISKKKRLSTYGISSDEYDALNSSGSCHICGGYLKKPYVDHCHETGKVRGILCQVCNSGIGMFRDSPEILRAAIDYLERGRA